MNSLKMSLSLENFALSQTSALSPESLRLVLLAGEQIRVPRKQRFLRVVSGRAWVSYDGKDHDLTSGQGLALENRKDSAIVSAMDDESLVFEVR